MDGRLQTREDIVIENWGDQEVTVVSAISYRPEEELTLELPGDRLTQLAVTVRDTRPTTGPDGSVRFRLRLAFDPLAVFADAESGNRDYQP